jgi:hypothetical protein
MHTPLGVGDSMFWDSCRCTLCRTSVIEVEEEDGRMRNQCGQKRAKLVTFYDGVRKRNGRKVKGRSKQSTSSLLSPLSRTLPSFVDFFYPSSHFPSPLPFGSPALVVEIMTINRCHVRNQIGVVTRPFFSFRLFDMPRKRTLLRPTQRLT